MKARRVKKLDPAGPLVENAARIIKTRVDELRSFAPAALEPAAEREQHDMRIAAKRLRYVLEATEELFGRPAKTARRRARDLQEILGEVHDCDVMLPRVDTHRAELRARDVAAVRGRAAGAADLDPQLASRAPRRTAYRGLETLAVYLAARRRVLFERFVGFWAEQESAGTWERLERAADRKLREARERRRAAERAAEAQRRLAEAERAEREAADRARQAAAQLAEARRAQDGSTDPIPSREA
ncbi:MAG TPA: CHAD domain-containing protein [Solirubrobacterales bacterium]|nr:CHAD domain-containing protein [Solirubrobacterales bacterium]